VINCNLQRLDGPVRGNGKIIQELEAAFRGAGWNAIKVIWGDDWDPLLAQDENGLLVKRMEEVPDGQYQMYSVAGGDYIRRDFFGKVPQLEHMVRKYTDEQLQKLRRGGHDPLKVYSAYHAAVQHQGAPTVILAKTIKGYGLGEAGEGAISPISRRSSTKRNCAISAAASVYPHPDDQIKETPFYRPSTKAKRSAT
jgi:pyruvate dehydrogenase E1 component